MALAECVGGPLDGRVFDTKEGDVLRVAAPTPMVWRSVYASEGLELLGEPVRYHVYCLRSQMDGSTAYRYEGVR